jgi:hypothetical protein
MSRISIVFEVQEAIEHSRRGDVTGFRPSASRAPHQVATSQLLDPL